MKITLLVAYVWLVFASCGPHIYKSPEFESALAKHRSVAILPAEVNMRLRAAQARKLTPEQLENMSLTTSYDIQDKMASWFLRESGNLNFAVAFQDIHKINARLKEAGISYRALRTEDRGKLAQILGVDAVIQTKLNMDKPMSETAAVATGILIGSFGTTNTIAAVVNINDGKSGRVLWSFDYTANGGIGSSSTALINNLMRKASKTFPYIAAK